MPNNYFEFKQFRICQDGAAMKVGTDGVLLGAWARLDGMEQRILDIGTGTGLIALMAAQRSPEALIDAVEIAPQAARQAAENAAHSPWTERIRIYSGPIQDFTPGTAVYDHILSNPPFFVESLKAPDACRAAARHNDTLSFQDLIAQVKNRLAPKGRFSVIYPVEESRRFQPLAEENGLFCNRKTQVRGTSDAPYKRILMEFSRQKGLSQDDGLTLESARHRYTDEYIALTRDFYLKF